MFSILLFNFNQELYVLCVLVQNGFTSEGKNTLWAIPRYLDHLHREILFFWQKSLRTIYTYHLVLLKLPKNVQGGPFQGLLVFYHFFPKIYNFRK